MFNSFTSVLIVPLLFALCFLAVISLVFYMLVKNAVKNGVLEALEEYHSEVDCE